MRTLYMCAACVLGSTVCANASTIVDPDMAPGSIGIDALLLADGEWTYGQLSQDPNHDWWTSGNNFLLRENWGGNFGVAVDFEMSAASADTGSVFPIGIMKDVTNSTTFGWTGFEIFIDAGDGATISNVTALANSEFADVTITDNGDGSFLISYGLGGGTGVSIGGDTMFDFDFDISGAIDFEIVQTPIPTPGSAALLTIAGLAAVRRRR
jgi:hypothetical protein